MTLFFEFCQNNSGGFFVTDDERGLGPRVWIEARDKADALNLAVQKGIYFDGVQDGRDCACCGDRWSEYLDAGAEAPSPDGFYDFLWHDTVYVHHLDGRIERLKSEKKT